MIIPTVLTFSLENTNFIKNTEFNQAKDSIRLIRIQMLQNLDMAFRSQANEAKPSLPSLLR